jgi:hypothetical protein
VTGRPLGVGKSTEPQSFYEVQAGANRECAPGVDSYVTMAAAIGDIAVMIPFNDIIDDSFSDNLVEIAIAPERIDELFSVVSLRGTDAPAGEQT